MEVKNKICVVTGSAQGLGKAFAKILLDHGAKVCISDLNSYMPALIPKLVQ